MKKYAVKWFSLVLSMAVFIGCAVFLAGRKPVAALGGTSGDALPDTAYGDVELNDLLPLDADDKTNDGTKAKPYKSTTEDNGITVEKTAYLDNDKIHVGYKVKGTNEMKKTDNVFIVENSDDKAGQLLDAIENYIKDNKDYIDDDSTFKVIAVHKDGETTETDTLTLEDFLDKFDTTDPSYQSLADELLSGKDKGNVLSKDELEDLVDDNDSGPSNPNSRKNIIVAAENADKITAEPEKATALVKLPADYDYEDDLPLDPNDVAFDIYQKINDSSLTGSPTKVVLKDNINSPFSITDDGAVASLDSYAPFTVPVNGTGLTKDVAAAYSVPALGSYTGMLDYDLEVEGDPKSVTYDDDGNVVATSDAVLTDEDDEVLVDEIPDTLVDADAPAMHIDKKVECKDAEITGDSVLNYTIVLENIGNTNLTGIKLTDSLVCSSNVGTSPAPSATTGTGSGTLTYLFKKTGTGDEGEIKGDASDDIELKPGEKLTATYSFTVPKGSTKSAPYLLNGKYLIKNTAKAEADEIEDKTIGDSTETPFKFMDDQNANGSGNASGNASGNPGDSGKDKDNKDNKDKDNKGDKDSKGDNDDKDNKTPDTGDKSVNTVVVIVMATAFLAACVSAFLIINERKVRKLVEEAARPN